MSTFSIMDDIAGEISRQCLIFKEQAVIPGLDKNDCLLDLYRFLKEKIPGHVDKDEFASIFSQTVIFSLLKVAVDSRYRGNQLMLGVLRKIAKFDHGNSIIKHIFETLPLLNIPGELKNFISGSKKRLLSLQPGKINRDDMLPLLYERFLKKHEPGLHKKIRYYYTPGPVVSFIVHSVNWLLKEKISIPGGLGNKNIRILDPAFGNANFLSAALKLALSENTSKYGEGIKNTFIQSYILNNIYGFEVMLPLYVLGCINIIKSFFGDASRTPLASGGKKINLYLTDTLEVSGSDEADEVKTGTSIPVIFCNPPYMNHSLNKGEWILKLIKDYGQLSKVEKNLKGLQDDYVKFIRFGQWKIQQAGYGVMGMVTNHAYLDNPTFRGMRQFLMQGFNEIYILNLHGNALKKEEKPDGSLDENIFDIRQGVAISIFIKTGKNTADCSVYYADIWGKRDYKFEQLDINGIDKIEWEQIYPEQEFYLFIPPFTNTFQKCAKKTSFCFIPDVCTTPTAPSLLGWGCHPPFTNTFQKCAKKTSFCFIPGVCTTSTAPSLLGWGCHPPFINTMKKCAEKTSFLSSPCFEPLPDAIIGWGRRPPVDKGFNIKTGTYTRFKKITDIFPVHSVGIITARDKLTISWNKDELYNRVLQFSKMPEKMALHNLKLQDDTRDWQVKRAQKDLVDSGLNRKKIVPILYRPFDIRYTYYTGETRGFICMPRAGVMRHMLNENIGLISVRQVAEGAFNHCWVTDTIVESRVTSSNKGIAYVFPLYIYLFPNNKKEYRNGMMDEKSLTTQPRQPNINPGIFNLFRSSGGFEPLPSPGQVFYYVYGVMNSSIYRETYRDHLKIDFPRIPFTRDYQLFIQLSRLGERLAAIHMMKAGELENTFSKFAVNGDNLVKKPFYKTGKSDGKVFINQTQYFSNIPSGLWGLKICGYKVLQKWLKDRKNRKLEAVEISTYLKICRALQLTLACREEIDRLYPSIEESIPQGGGI